mgnify:CR=1 FL=1
MCVAVNWPSLAKDKQIVGGIPLLGLSVTEFAQEARSQTMNEGPKAEVLARSWIQSLAFQEWPAMAERRVEEQY